MASPRGDLTPTYGRTLAAAFAIAGRIEIALALSEVLILTSSSQRGEQLPRLLGHLAMPYTDHGSNDTLISILAAGSALREFTAFSFRMFWLQGLGHWFSWCPAG